MDRPLLLAAILGTLTACTGTAEAPDQKIVVETAATPKPEAPTPATKSPAGGRAAATEAPPVDHTCFSQGERGVYDKPNALTNADGLATIQKVCLQKGGTVDACDASKVMSQASALCFTGKSEPDTVKLLLSTDLKSKRHAEPPRLVWYLANDGCSSSFTIDATTGAQLEVSRCRRGRPCTMAEGLRRASAIQRTGWV